MLEDIGFYTLSNKRVMNVSKDSRLKRCELILTDRCNFKCPYCRGIRKDCKGDLPKADAISIIEKWTEHNLESIRFSGGEPTLYPHLEWLAYFSRFYGVKNIAISTNGTADTDFYMDLINAGVNDFSISLDSCCSSVADKMSGVEGSFDKVINNIEKLSKETYVTVGVVLNESNDIEVSNIIEFASGLGVSDIRIIPSAQYNSISTVTCSQVLVDKHPILKYRLHNLRNNKPFRGLSGADTGKCSIVLDDMAVLKDKHFPCIIYMREQGDAIGSVDKTMGEIRQDRYDWFLKHDSRKDPICSKNCLDVCIAHNNLCQKVQESKVKWG